MSHTEPALTLQQPWASAIFRAGKDVENRTWPTRYRGLLVIHAGKTWDARAADVLLLADLLGSMGPHTHYPRGLLGTVRLVDVTRDQHSAWAAPGLWHWVLADPRPFPEPIPCRGRMGLFPVAIP